MIENVNKSKNPSTEIVDYKKIIGVASVHIVSINPNNEKLRQYGWSISDDADEPRYVITDEATGKIKSTRVRFLVQIQDIEGKPIVPMDFWVRPDITSNKDSSKWKIIDSYGRTAWGTTAEVKNKKIPQYANGAANIDAKYKPCHQGEEELVRFLMRYLNCTTLTSFSKVHNKYIVNKNPGRLTIDSWDKLCKGDISEIASYVASMPDNRLKVIFGVRTTEDNKEYQTFLNTGYVSNGSTPGYNGEYQRARTLIDKFFEGKEDSQYSFSATPAIVWGATATEVKDNSEEMFDSNYTVTDNFEDDLPFD